MNDHFQKGYLFKLAVNRMTRTVISSNVIFILITLSADSNSSPKQGEESYLQQKKKIKFIEHMTSFMCAQKLYKQLDDRFNFQ